MSMYGSQKGINSNRKGSARSDVTGGGNYQYTRSEAGQGGGNGYGPADPFIDAYSYTFSSGGGAGGSGHGGSGLHQKAMILQEQCQDFLRKAEHAIQTGGDAERFMAMARETIDQLKGCASQLRQIGQPNDNVVRSVEVCRDQLKGVHMAISETLHRRRKSTRGNSGVWEDPGRTYVDAMGWIGQQKRLIETSPWGDDQETLQQQLVKHQMFHSSIQRSDEMDRARDELHQNGDKASLNALDQEWDSLQKMSFSRSEWLQELQLIIEDISKEIMWVNYREEEELVFDWGERNIDLYIPKKQESYSQLMSALEGKERDLNRLKVKVDVALKNNHPASDKIEAYMDTLQTQWSWLLQITKCIHVHLKENAAYSQFFKEANETYGALQKEHETIRKKFTCDKDTSLDSLLELLAELEKEKEKILENKRQVQHLVNMSKSIVRLKPRNPEEKSSSTVIVRALCDFKQDQKVICKDNEGILKDNSQRSKWQVTGPGGLDMLVPSVCLLVPPPNPISISMAKKNDQYYEAILSIWNQLYINIKSLISWQYCCMDIENINSLTVAMLSRMSSEEYRSLIKQLETHYAEFRVNSHGSQMIEEEDLMTIESQYNGAQNHYEQLVVQLPSYTQYASTDYAVQLQNIEPQKVEPKWQLVHQPMYLIQQPCQQVVIQEEQQIRMERMERMREVEEEEERRRVEIRRLEENRRMEEEARKREEALMLEEEMRQREQAKRREEERRRTEEAARKREE
ncbi:desmoplakin-like, partial [Gadus morhua]|uniref:desmoplakin-like n=1 Tax=Gadus morhua TaxID=8049 RepID=UPI0011B6BA77